MDFRVGNLRRDRSSILVDVYVGQETDAIACIDLLSLGIVRLDANERPLTEGRQGRSNCKIGASPGRWIVGGRDPLLVGHGHAGRVQPLASS